MEGGDVYHITVHHFMAFSVTFQKIHTSLDTRYGQARLSWGGGLKFAF